MPGVPTIDYYQVLGVTRDATEEEIKKTYRQLAREIHPDVAPDDAEKAERFKSIVEAYEWLRDPQKRKLLDLMGFGQSATASSPFDDKTPEPEPEDELFEVGNVTCRVTYGNSWWGEVAYVWVRVSDLSKLTDLPALNYRIGRVNVTADTGWDEVLFSAHSLESVRWQYKTWQEEQRKQERQADYERRLHKCERKFRELTSRGLPVERLGQLLGEARAKFHLLDHWRRGTTSDQMLAALRAVEKEIESLGGDPTEVIPTYFMAGKLHHPDVEFNRRIIERLEELAIRSSGCEIEIEPLSEEALRQHYEQCLAGVHSLEELQLRDLRLRLEDYAPADILSMLDLAPEEVKIQGRKTVRPYRVSYRYLDHESQKVAVGVVRIPLNAYEQNAAEHGKRSTFPELPSGIRLFLEVTANGDGGHVIARGFNDEELASRIKKFLRSQQRSKNVPHTDELGIKRWAPLQGTPLPPWHCGVRPRW